MVQRVRPQAKIGCNGRGFDVENPSETPRSGHFGLVNLRDRIAAVQGILEIDSEPTVGTTIIAKIPVVTRTTSATNVKTSKYLLDSQHASREVESEDQP